MATLVILLGSFLIFWSMNRYVFRNQFTLSFIGRASLSIMLLFTGISHFMKTNEMVQMMPEFLPYKIQLVYVTGMLELSAALGLVLKQTIKLTSIVLLVFFIAILPANIIGSLKKVELGGMENGPGYLYFRIPLQILFIWWTYYFGLRLAPKDHLAVNKRTIHS